MKRMLLGAAMMLALPTCASAQLVDPTAFHVTSPSATGSDPVLLNESSTFTVNANDLPAGDTILSPLDIYLIFPTTQAAPVVTDALFEGLAANSDTFTLTSVAQWNTSTDNSFYKDYLGCGGGCNGSINQTNVQTAENSVGLGMPTTFNVDLLSVAMNGGAGFTIASQFETILGTFAQGTIVAPFATNTPAGFVYDTSWTNAGFQNVVVPVVPETSTWVMMLLGFGMLAIGAAARRGERHGGGRDHHFGRLVR